MRRVLGMMAVVGLVACGGGGGGNPDTFSLDTHALQFGLVTGGAASDPQVVHMTISSDEVAYVAAGYVDGSSPPGWLGVSMDTTPGGADFTITVHDAGLSPGTYTNTFQLGSADANGNLLETEDVTVTVSVAAFTVSPGLVLFDGLDGHAPGPQSFQVAIDTAGHQPVPFTVEVPAEASSWLQATPASGSAGPAGTAVSLDVSSPPGSYQATVAVRATVGGQVVTRTVDVGYQRDAEHLYAAASGVGLTAAPGRSVLARDVKVLSSLGATEAGWAASADQGWLTVTGSGSAGQALHLAADPTGLAAGLHEATVTVTADDDALGSASVRVVLAVLADAPADLSVTGDASPGIHAAASPTEPWVFLSSDGPDVSIRDVHTGALVRTLSGVAAHAFELAVSGDGRQLFVHDPIVPEVVQLDVGSGQVIRRYPGTVYGTSPIVVMHPGGLEVLVTADGRIHDTATGAEVGSPGLAVQLAGSVAVSPEQTYLVTKAGEISRVQRTVLSSTPVRTQYAFGTGTIQGGGGNSACFSADSAMVYTASGAPYEFPGVSMTTHEIVRHLPGSAYPNAIACAWNGLVIGGINGAYEPKDVWVYSAAGAELAHFSSSSETTNRTLWDHGLAVSADGARLVTLVSRSGGVGEVRFQTLPAPQ
ncbi:MAG: hypothetical protein QM767_04840 [Anaeromyxobacter sp.]